jgi:hypothetical protein
MTQEKEYILTQKNKTEELLTHFQHIRKTNSYGINEIDKYFNDFLDYESILYGLDRYYRDHVNHVLQVWAIGISLISHSISKIKLNDSFTIDCTKDFHFEIEQDENSEQKVSKSELFAMWTVIVLCHDLGYPIEKTFQINRQVKRIITYFGNMQFTELDYSFSILNTFLVEKFLNIISSKVVKLEDKKKRIERKKRIFKPLFKLNIEINYQNH